MYRAMFAELTRKGVKTQHHRLASRPAPLLGGDG